ncbi:hypothetical protein Tco_1169905 [Tanacetum coccineum]
MVRRQQDGRKASIGRFRRTSERASSQSEDIMLWLLPLSKSKTVTSIVGGLIVASTSYFLWRERNDRIHGKGDKKVEQVSKYVADSVRLKLTSIKFKKNARVRKLETWKLALELMRTG